MFNLTSLLEYIQFPTVWIYLMLSNVVIMFVMSRLAKGQITEEIKAENAKKTVLFVVAHPDDESMFFVPTILSMKNMGYTMHVLCLSNGGADGLGKKREKEMEQAAQILGFDAHFVIDDKRLPDGLKTNWDIGVIQEVVKHRLSLHSYKGIVTFDRKGVSGHANHVATSLGIHALRKEEAYKDIKMFELVTVNIIRKYISVLDGIFTGFDRLVFMSNTFWVNWKAMYTHKSQFVWYRWFFLVFSRYVYINHLNELPFEATSPKTEGQKEVPAS